MHVHQIHQVHTEVCGQRMQSSDVFPMDEISDYPNARYVSSNEAAWRRGILQQYTGLCFRATMLTEFFALCRVDDFVKTLLFYMNIPKYYTWNNFPGVKEAHVLGRVYTINPCQGECFYAFASYQRSIVFTKLKSGRGSFQLIL